MTNKEYQKNLQENLERLNKSWIKKLLTSENVLLEKQTLFWHNHFACRVRHPFLMQELNREANTLGSKSVAVETTKVSMELKVFIEQMREQIQNIE